MASVALDETVDSILNTLPPVWDRIRANLRSAATASFGITLEQFHVLRHIRKGYHSVSELATKKQISRAAVSQAVQILVAKGLVTRQPRMEDRRCVWLEITPFAAKILEQHYEANRVWMRAQMSALVPEERAVIRKAMSILRETFIPGEQ